MNRIVNVKNLIMIIVKNERGIFREMKKKKYILTCWNQECMMHGCKSKKKICFVCGWKIRKLRDYDNE